MTRPATFDERRKWGECPVCKAPHGVECDLAVSGDIYGFAEKAHRLRVVRAPVYVREVTKLEAA